MAQLPPPNRIPIDEWLNRVKAFYDAHPYDTSSTTHAWIRELFTLHNDKFLPRESGEYCSKCANRVYHNLKRQYDKMKTQ